jgi:sigma-B regulation protein RsbU (phosphoserine phosphatase)
MPTFIHRHQPVGIWETFNDAGEMFGRERFKNLLRQYAEGTAGEILTAVFDHLTIFSGGRRPEDDITLVIIKIKKKRSSESEEG